MSDSDYFAIQKRIVSVFHDFPDLQFIVKLHPNPSYPLSPIVQLAADLGIDNCLFVRDMMLSEVLPLGDLFINDSPTTTLLQMLTTGKRVLVFNHPALQWEDGALELLRRSAILSDDLAEFLHLLRDHLASRRFGPLETDDGEFLRRYGTCLGDGRSAERVVAALSAIGRGDDQRTSWGSAT